MLNELPTEDFEAKGLDPEKVRAGKAEGLGMLVRYGVVEDIARDAAADLKVIRARWECQGRPDGSVKCRYVAQEFKWMEQRDDTFATTSSVTTSRLVDVYAGLLGESGCVFVADCVSAYYQADQTEEVAVEPAPEYIALRAARGESTDILWRLRKMLPGQRVAGAGWAAKLRAVQESIGFEACPTHPQFYLDRAARVLVESHMDDLYGAGPTAGAENYLVQLRESLDVKATQGIATGAFAHLKRERARCGGRLFVAPAEKHYDAILEALGCDRGGVMPTPSLGKQAEDDPEGEELLDEAGVHAFRSAVGSALYVSSDRWDIQRDLQLCTRFLGAPRVLEWKRMLRIARYLNGTRSYGCVISPRTVAEHPDILNVDLYSDTDHGGCKESRKSTSCGVVLVNGVPVCGFSRRQAIIAASSGESELYGACSVVAEGRGLANVLRWIGYEVVLTLYTDSSAAKSIICRSGVGGMKHIDRRALWLQQEREMYGLRVRKVQGSKNYADIGTKSHTRSEFGRLRDLCGIVPRPAWASGLPAAKTT